MIQKIETVPEKKKAIILAELKRIEAEEGSLTPALIVQKAESVDSPLHDLFEWDDFEAGYKYRLWQARIIIGSIRIEYSGKEIKAFENVKMSVSYADRKYISTERVLNDDVLKRQVISRAVSEIKYWKKKYETLKELDGIVDEGKIAELEK